MVYESKSISSYLNRELNRRLQANPRYSLRAFAKCLGLSAGALSEILRGRRPLSLKSIPRISRALGLTKSEALHIIKLLQSDKVSEISSGDADRTEIDSDVFQLVSGWHHFAILNLLDCEDREWKPTWIAKRLGIPVMQAKLAMDLLVRTGLVLGKNGRPSGRSLQIVTGGEVPSPAIRNYHRQILDKAKEAVETQSVQTRDFSGCGFAFDPSRINELKTELAEFQDYLIDKYKTGRRTEVYFLEMALFKLTQEEK